MALPSKSEAKQCYAANYKGNFAWLNIDFEQWWKAKSNPVCLIEAGGRKGAVRCAAPCVTCVNRFNGGTGNA